MTDEMPTGRPWPAIYYFNFSCDDATDRRRVGQTAATAVIIIIIIIRLGRRERKESMHCVFLPSFLFVAYRRTTREKTKIAMVCWVVLRGDRLFSCMMALTSRSNNETANIVLRSSPSSDSPSSFLPFCHQIASAPD